MEERIAYRPAEAIRVFPIGRSALYENIRSGKIKSFTVGRARFIPHESLVEFMRAAMAENVEGAA